jgi:hypothetical protein
MTLNAIFVKKKSINLENNLMINEIIIKNYLFAFIKL